MSTIFKIPEINIKPKKTTLTKEAVTTIKAMSTNLVNKGFGGIVEKYLDFKVSIETITELENKLFEDISKYHKSPSDDLMMEIFHGIQLWGGRSGRNIYVMGDGFEKNFSRTTYKNLIHECIHGNIESILVALKKFDNEVTNLGLAFITKHIRFWSSQNKNIDMLPIYDSVMSKGLIGVEKPKMNDLKGYWTSMLTFANERNLSSEVLERSLFNYFRVNNK